ncbi:uncharacterized protein LOC106877042, partial [Octopus bimaculoides]|uniref:uncharacterized protein LOC106877042 n=1 Tax=Octopus bimaculoides TaxID=37653 RepID=UPI0022E869F6
MRNLTVYVWRTCSTNVSHKMDLPVIVHELRTLNEQYKKRVTDKEQATAVYCKGFCTILQKFLDKHNDSYEEYVFSLCIFLCHYAASYGELAVYDSKEKICQQLFRLCIKAVLDVKWRELSNENTCRQKFRETVDAVHTQLERFNYGKFQLIKKLMETHWDHPTLNRIMAGADDLEESEVMEYFAEEDPMVLKVRVEMLLDENCEEFAMNLCRWCFLHPELADNVQLRETQLLMLYRSANVEKLQEDCSKISCEMAVQIIKNLQDCEAHQGFCVMIAQTFLVQNWLRGVSADSGTKTLLKLWIRLQYLVDGDLDKFSDSVWAIAKLSQHTEQITFLVESLREEAGDTFLQLNTNLCIYAFNLDKGCLEQAVADKDMELILCRNVALSKTSQMIMNLYDGLSQKLAKLSGLTAFALDPSEENFEIVYSIFHSNNNNSNSSSLGGSSNHNDIDGSSPNKYVNKLTNMLDGLHVSPTKEVKKSKEKQRTQRNRHSMSHRTVDNVEYCNLSVNPANLYEIERLLNNICPFHLDIEMSFSDLHAMCMEHLTQHQEMLMVLHEESTDECSEFSNFDEEQPLSEAAVQNNETAAFTEQCSQENVNSNVIFSSPPPQPHTATASVTTAASATTAVTVTSQENCTEPGEGLVGGHQVGTKLEAKCACGLPKSCQVTEEVCNCKQNLPNNSCHLNQTYPNSISNRNLFEAFNKDLSTQPYGIQSGDHRHSMSEASKIQNACERDIKNQQVSHCSGSGFPNCGASTSGTCSCDRSGSVHTCLSFESQIDFSNIGDNSSSSSSLMQTQHASDKLHKARTKDSHCYCNKSLPSISDGNVNVTAPCKCVCKTKTKSGKKSDKSAKCDKNLQQTSEIKDGKDTPSKSLYVSSGINEDKVSSEIPTSDRLLEKLQSCISSLTGNNAGCSTEKFLLSKIEKSYIDRYCQFLKSVSQFEMALLTQQNSKPSSRRRKNYVVVYRCGICCDFFDQVSELKNHIQSICKASVSDLQNLTEAATIFCAKDSALSKIKFFKCLKCLQYTCTRKEMDDHLRLCGVPLVKKTSKSTNTSSLAEKSQVQKKPSLTLEDPKTKAPEKEVPKKQQEVVPSVPGTETINVSKPSICPTEEHSMKTPVSKEGSSSDVTTSPVINATMETTTTNTVFKCKEEQLEVDPENKEDKKPKVKQTSEEYFKCQICSRLLLGPHRLRLHQEACKKRNDIRRRIKKTNIVKPLVNIKTEVVTPDSQATEGSTSHPQNNLTTVNTTKVNQTTVTGTSKVEDAPSTIANLPQPEKPKHCPDCERIIKLRKVSQQLSLSEAQVKIEPTEITDKNNSRSVCSEEEIPNQPNSSVQNSSMAHQEVESKAVKTDQPATSSHRSNMNNDECIKRTMLQIKSEMENQFLPRKPVKPDKPLQDSPPVVNKVIETIETKSVVSEDDLLLVGDSTMTMSPSRKMRILSPYCRKCDFHFRNRSNFVKHLAITHLQPYTKETVSELSKPIVIFTCVYCQIAFRVWFKYINHIPNHATHILKELNCRWIKETCQEEKTAVVSGKGAQKKTQLKLVWPPPEEEIGSFLKRKRRKPSKRKFNRNASLSNISQSTISNFMSASCDVDNKTKQDVLHVMHNLLQSIVGINDQVLANIDSVSYANKKSVMETSKETAAQLLPEPCKSRLSQNITAKDMYEISTNTASMDETVQQTAASFIEDVTLCKTPITANDKSVVVKEDQELPLLSDTSQSKPDKLTLDVNSGNSGDKALSTLIEGSVKPASTDPSTNNVTKACLSTVSSESGDSTSSTLADSNKKTASTEPITNNVVKSCLPVITSESGDCLKVTNTLSAEAVKAGSLDNIKLKSDERSQELPVKDASQPAPETLIHSTTKQSVKMPIISSITPELQKICRLTMDNNSLSPSQCSALAVTTQSALSVNKTATLPQASAINPPDPSTATFDKTSVLPTSQNLEMQLSPASDKPTRDLFALNNIQVPNYLSLPALTSSPPTSALNIQSSSISKLQPRFCPSSEASVLMSSSKSDVSSSPLTSSVTDTSEVANTLLPQSVTPNQTYSSKQTVVSKAISPVSSTHLTPSSSHSVPFSSDTQTSLPSTLGSSTSQTTPHSLNSPQVCTATSSKYTLPHLDISLAPVKHQTPISSLDPKILVPCLSTNIITPTLTETSTNISSSNPKVSVSTLSPNTKLVSSTPIPLGPDSSKSTPLLVSNSSSDTMSEVPSVRVIPSATKIPELSSSPNTKAPVSNSSTFTSSSATDTSTLTSSSTMIPSSLAASSSSTTSTLIPSSLHINDNRASDILPVIKTSVSSSLSSTETAVANTSISGSLPATDTPKSCSSSETSSSSSFHKQNFDAQNSSLGLKTILQTDSLSHSLAPAKILPAVSENNLMVSRSVTPTISTNFSPLLKNSTNNSAASSLSVINNHLADSSGTSSLVPIVLVSPVSASSSNTKASSGSFVQPPTPSPSDLNISTSNSSSSNVNIMSKSPPTSSPTVTEKTPVTICVPTERDPQPISTSVSPIFTSPTAPLKISTPIPSSTFTLNSSDLQTTKRSTSDTKTLVTDLSSSSCTPNVSESLPLTSGITASSSLSTSKTSIPSSSDPQLLSPGLKTISSSADTKPLALNDPNSMKSSTSGSFTTSSDSKSLGTKTSAPDLTDSPKILASSSINSPKILVPISSDGPEMLASSSSDNCKTLAPTFADTSITTASSSTHNPRTSTDCPKTDNSKMLPTSLTTNTTSTLPKALDSVSSVTKLSCTVSSSTPNSVKSTILKTLPPNSTSIKTKSLDTSGPQKPMTSSDSFSMTTPVISVSVTPTPSSTDPPKPTYSPCTSSPTSTANPQTLDLSCTSVPSNSTSSPKAPASHSTFVSKAPVPSSTSSPNIPVSSSTSVPKTQSLTSTAVSKTPAPISTISSKTPAPSSTTTPRTPDSSSTSVPKMLAPGSTTPLNTPIPKTPTLSSTPISKTTTLTPTATSNSSAPNSVASPAPSVKATSTAPTPNSASLPKITAPSTTASPSSTSTPNSTVIPKIPTTSSISLSKISATITTATPNSSPVLKTPVPCSTATPKTPVPSSTSVPKIPTSISAVASKTPAPTTSSLKTSHTVTTSSSKAAAPTVTTVPKTSTTTKISTIKTQVSFSKTPASTTVDPPKTPASTITDVPKTPASTTIDAAKTPSSTTTDVLKTPVSTADVPKTPASTTIDVPKTPASTTTDASKTAASTTTDTPRMLTPTTSSALKTTVLTSTSSSKSLTLNSTSNTSETTTTTLSMIPLPSSNSQHSTPTSISTCIQKNLASSSTSSPQVPSHSTNSTHKASPASIVSTTKTLAANTASALQIKPIAPTSTTTPKPPAATSTTTPKPPAATSTTTPKTPAAASTTTPKTPAPPSTTTSKTSTPISTATSKTSGSISTTTPKTPAPTSTSTPKTPAFTSTTTPKTPAPTSTTNPKTPATTSTITNKTPVITSTSSPNTSASISTAAPKTAIPSITAVSKTPAISSTIASKLPAPSPASASKTPVLTSTIIPKSQAPVSAAASKSAAPNSTSSPNTPAPTSTSAPKTPAPTSTTTPNTQAFSSVSSPKSLAPSSTSSPKTQAPTSTTTHKTQTPSSSSTLQTSSPNSSSSTTPTPISTIPAPTSTTTHNTSSPTSTCTPHLPSPNSPPTPSTPSPSSSTLKTSTPSSSSAPKTPAFSSTDTPKILASNSTAKSISPTTTAVSRAPALSSTSAPKTPEPTSSAITKAPAPSSTSTKAPAPSSTSTKAPAPAPSSTTAPKAPAPSSTTAPKAPTPSSTTAPKPPAPSSTTTLKAPAPSSTSSTKTPAPNSATTPKTPAPSSTSNMKTSTPNSTSTPKAPTTTTISTKTPTPSSATTPKVPARSSTTTTSKTPTPSSTSSTKTPVSITTTPKTPAPKIATVTSTTTSKASSLSCTSSPAVPSSTSTSNTLLSKSPLKSTVALSNTTSKSLAPSSASPSSTTITVASKTTVPTSTTASKTTVSTSTTTPKTTVPISTTTSKIITPISTTTSKTTTPTTTSKTTASTSITTSTIASPSSAIASKTTVPTSKATAPISTIASKTTTTTTTAKTTPPTSTVTAKTTAPTSKTTPATSTAASKTTTPTSTTASKTTTPISTTASKPTPPTSTTASKTTAPTSTTASKTTPPTSTTASKPTPPTSTTASKTTPPTSTTASKTTPPTSTIASKTTPPTSTTASKTTAPTSTTASKTTAPTSTTASKTTPPASSTASKTTTLTSTIASKTTPPTSTTASKTTPPTSTTASKTTAPTSTTASK